MSYYLPEDVAINNVANIIHEIYTHRPTSIVLTLKASVDAVATVHVEYDAHVFERKLNEGKEKE